MKVAFIGTHGVGKTTLCYELAAALKREGIHVDIVKEVARLSPLPINQKTSLEAQTWIFLTQMAEEIRSGSQHDVIVCDRSVLDNYAYMMLAFGRQLIAESGLAHAVGTDERDLHSAPPVPRPAGFAFGKVALRSCFGLTGHLLRPTPSGTRSVRWPVAPASCSSLQCRRVGPWAGVPSITLRSGLSLLLLGAHGFGAHAYLGAWPPHNLGTAHG